MFGPCSQLLLLCWKRMQCHFQKLFGVMPAHGRGLLGNSFFLLCSFRSRNAVGPSGRPPACTTSLPCVGICITGSCRIPKTSVLSTAWWVTPSCCWCGCHLCWFGWSSTNGLMQTSEQVMLILNKCLLRTSLGIRWCKGYKWGEHIILALKRECQWERQIRIQPP